MLSSVIHRTFLLLLIVGSLEAAGQHRSDYVARAHLRALEEGMLAQPSDCSQAISWKRVVDLEDAQRRTWTELVLREIFPGNAAAQSRQAAAIEASVALCRLKQQEHNACHRRVRQREIFGQLALKIFPKSLGLRLAYDARRPYSRAEITAFIARLDERTLKRAEQVHRKLARELKPQSRFFSVQARAVLARMQRQLLGMMDWVATLGREIEAQSRCRLAQRAKRVQPAQDAVASQLLAQAQLASASGSIWQSDLVCMLRLSPKQSANYGPHLNQNRSSRQCRALAPYS